MSKLPKGWIEKELKDCVEILDSKRKPVNNKERQQRIEGKEQSDLYPYFGATGQVGYIDNYLFDGNYVVLGEDGVPFFDPKKHKAYLLNGKTWVNNHAHVLNGIEVENRYLCYYLNQFDYHGYVNGATRLKLTQANMRKIPLHLAPKYDQKRIADKLDSVLAKVEAAQARLDKIPTILKRFRQSVLAAATSGELTKDWRQENNLEIDDWKRPVLSEIAKCLDPNPSHRYPKPDTSGVPILSTQQFVGLDSWTTDKAKLVNREFFLERKEKTKFLENDIVFARKGRLGLARMAPRGFDFVYSHTVFIVRANGVNTEFLLWMLRREETINWLTKEMNSNTGVPTLGKAVFEKLPVPLPCEKEQLVIVNKINELFEHANTIEKQYITAKTRIDKLTQSILTKAFRGELLSRDVANAEKQINHGNVEVAL